MDKIISTRRVSFHRQTTSVVRSKGYQPASDLPSILRWHHTRNPNATAQRRSEGMERGCSLGVMALNDGIAENFLTEG